MILPEIIDKVYNYRSKTRNGQSYPSSKIDMDIMINKESQQQIQQLNQRKKLTQVKSSHQAERFYKTTSKERLLRTEGGPRFEVNGNNGNYEQLNQVLQQQNINMRVVMDNVSRNVLIYTPTEKGRLKFKSSQQSDKIKQYDMQIEKYKKIMEEALKLQLEQENQENYAENEAEHKNEFEFLTGVGIQDKQREQENQEEIKEEPEQLPPEDKIQQPQIQQNKPPDLKQKFNRIYDFYQNEISKAFINKEKKIRQRVKKKVKLKIIPEKNKIKSTGQPQDQNEHLMRIYNKEFVPCKPYVMVPTFSSKKDNIANCVVAYLKDYKPLLNGEKQLMPKSLQQLLELEIDLVKTGSNNNNNNLNNTSEKTMPTRLNNINGRPSLRHQNQQMSATSQEFLVNKIEQKKMSGQLSDQNNFLQLQAQQIQQQLSQQYQPQQQQQQQQQIDLQQLPQQKQEEVQQQQQHQNLSDPLHQQKAQEIKQP